MMTRNALALISLALLGARSQEDLAPPLTDQSLERMKELILPQPKDLLYQQIPWRATLWNAVVEAQEKDRPILLWAMNGHPLACT